MHTIEIDDAVFAHLQRHAIPYVETPNHTIRRLLLGQKANDHMGQTTQKPAAQVNGLVHTGKKSPKASLSALISAGVLREGQPLYLCDYQGKPVPNCEAKITGPGLMWNGSRYSMSNLAKILLKKQGYQSDSVRGPAHWTTDDGITVLELWGQYSNNDRQT